MWELRKSQHHSPQQQTHNTARAAQLNQVKGVYSLLLASTDLPWNTYWVDQRTFCQTHKKTKQLCRIWPVNLLHITHSGTRRLWFYNLSQTDPINTQEVEKNTHVCTRTRGWVRVGVCGARKQKFPYLSKWGNAGISGTIENSSIKSRACGKLHFKRLLTLYEQTSHHSRMWLKVSFDLYFLLQSFEKSCWMQDWVLYTVH